MSRADVEASTVRWRFDLAYDGTDFSGWAVQPGFRTVQGELELWLTRILRLDEPARLVCAGRTDAGVHARGQVAHCDLPAGAIDDGGQELLRRLVRVLPEDVVVRQVVAAPSGFDARFAAIWRRYAYRIFDAGSVPDPLLRRTVARVPEALDLAAMNEAASVLVGFQDFGAFCRRRDGGTTIRELLELSGVRLDDGPLAGVIEFTVRADAFCHSMVRSLVGALVSVGTGRRDRAWLAQVTAAAVRESTVTVMPPGGLTLEEVGYPDPGQLARRARESRAVRELTR
ncbi:MAG TPA: tRNA pseudouridine(38-40) synthase TruA [Propionibacteriaceae bacterium]